MRHSQVKPRCSSRHAAPQQLNCQCQACRCVLSSVAITTMNPNVQPRIRVCFILFNFAGSSTTACTRKTGVQALAYAVTTQHRGMPGATSAPQSMRRLRRMPACLPPCTRGTKQELFEHSFCASRARWHTGSLRMPSRNFRSWTPPTLSLPPLPAHFPPYTRGTKRALMGLVSCLLCTLAHRFSAHVLSTPGPLPCSPCHRYLRTSHHTQEALNEPFRGSFRASCAHRRTSSRRAYAPSLQSESTCAPFLPPVRLSACTMTTKWAPRAHSVVVVHVLSFFACATVSLPPGPLVCTHCRVTRAPPQHKCM
jgi:hypothetical protein